MKRLFSMVVVVVATGALLTACVGSSGDEGTSAENEREAQAAPVATQEAESMAEDEQGEEAAPAATQEAEAADEQGDGAAPVATQQGQPVDEDKLISLLEQSSEAQMAVESLRGRMDSEINMTGMAMSMTAEYAFRPPGEMYIDTQAGPASSEIVMTEGRMFMRLAGGEWEELPSEEVLPFDVESMMGMGTVSAPDLGLLENLSLGEGEVIDGVKTVHVSYEIDMAKAMEQASDILGEGFSDLLGETGGMVDLSGKAPMDVWLGESDKLPRRVMFHMEGQVLGEDYDMDVAMDFFGYGEPVDIPFLQEMLQRIGG